MMPPMRPPRNEKGEMDVANGKASKPIEATSPAAVRRCGVENTQNLLPVTGLQPLLDVRAQSKPGCLHRI